MNRRALSVCTIVCGYAPNDYAPSRILGACCINFPRKGDLFMTIMPFLAQGETVAPRQPVMHHGFPKMHHDFGQCTKLSPEMHHENEKCTKLFLKCTKANGKMQPGFLILSK